jgi:hypothetical protein
MKYQKDPFDVSPAVGRTTGMMELIGAFIQQFLANVPKKRSNIRLSHVPSADTQSYEIILLHMTE